MFLPESFWTSLTYVVNIFTLSPSHGVNEQTPLILHEPGHSHHDFAGGDISSTFVPEIADSGPIFTPPGAPAVGEGSNFQCNYSTMIGWKPCSTFEDRTCWLTNGKQNFSVFTDYEDVPAGTPQGTNRHYEFDVTDDTVLNADGLPFPNAKLFNRKYPGTWVQGCWGDTVFVKINNQMKYNGGNGTSIHWHGLRQLNSSHMDGVNGVTQCPIAPGDSFTYKLKINQYGTSWYHSHYSVQYADGLLGPMTFHGPTSLPYDIALPPLFMTDWGHNSAFKAIQLQGQGVTDFLGNGSLLLNGRGNITKYNNQFDKNLAKNIPTPHTIRFQSLPFKGRPRRYLLRLINTAFDTDFIFSIDNHLLTIVGADFVPVYGNVTQKTIFVAIGQRYNVIVNAQPQPDGTRLPSDPNELNFWIRTWTAGDKSPTVCPKNSKFLGKPGTPGYETLGILRYGVSTADPVSKAWSNPNGDQYDCEDDYFKLTPTVPWRVITPIANDPSGVGENFTLAFDSEPNIYPLATWKLGDTPLYVDYSEPTFLKLNYSGPFDPLWNVFPETSESKWVAMVIQGGIGHPIHLHGHDFAILDAGPLPAPDVINLNSTFNPPRRDVVLIPQKGGYIVIAFKTDNPGNWLMHCHIAFHASGGLGLQFLERQKDALALWPDHSPAIVEAQRVCDNWNRWWGDCRDWWPGDGKSCGIGNSGFSPDSGI